MSLYATATEHYRNGPETWTVTRRSATSWAVVDTNGNVLDTQPRKADAQAVIDNPSGFFRKFHDEESLDWAALPVRRHWRMDDPMTSPAALAEFERIWHLPARSGEGFSEADLTTGLQEDLDMRGAVLAGTMRPSRVVGTGYAKPREAALDYLSAGIARTERALATRGRSEATNRANVDYRIVRPAARAAEAPAVEADPFAALDAAVAHESGLLFV